MCRHECLRSACALERLSRGIASHGNRQRGCVGALWVEACCKACSACASSHLESATLQGGEHSGCARIGNLCGRLATSQLVPLGSLSKVRPPRCGIFLGIEGPQSRGKALRALPVALPSAAESLAERCKRAGGVSVCPCVCMCVFGVCTSPRRQGAFPDSAQAGPLELHGELMALNCAVLAERESRGMMRSRKAELATTHRGPDRRRQPRQFHTPLLGEGPRELVVGAESLALFPGNDGGRGVTSLTSAVGVGATCGHTLDLNAWGGGDR